MPYYSLSCDWGVNVMEQRYSSGLRNLSWNHLGHVTTADEGQVLVLTALALFVLLTVAGLGIDVGYLRYEKQQMQKAADAGANAGAAALVYGGNYTAAARNDAAANGFTHGSNGITVTVNDPPQTPGDPFYNQTGYVEVIVAQPQPTFFMKVGGFNSVNVSARSVGSALGNASGCIYVLDPSTLHSFDVEGTATINSACGILVNSNDPAAFKKTGSGNITVSSGGFGIVGGTNIAGSGTITPTPTTGIAPFSDPLAGLVAPTYTTCNFSNTTIGSSGAHLSHGTYCNGIKITGSGTVIFDAGTYVLLGGGLWITGTPTLTGTNVTFYNTGNSTYTYKPVQVNGSGSTVLSAPTTGPLAGILFFQDRSIISCCSSITDNSVNGSNGAVYTGALYFPSTPIIYTGSSSLSAYSIIVGWQVTMVGSSTLNDDYTSLPGGSPVHTGFLAE